MPMPGTLGATLAVAHAGFPMASSGRYGTPQRGGTPPRTKETKPCWIRDGRPQGSPLRGPRRRVVRYRGDAIAPVGRAVAHAGFPMASSGRYGTPQRGGTPPRTKETKPCWIRDGRPQGSPLRGPRRRVVRYRGDAIAPVGRAVAHAGFPMASFRSVRDAARAWHATSYEGNEAVLDSGWATARVAPTRASSPGCSVQGRRYRARRARRRPCRFPDGLVPVGTGRREGVARHLRTKETKPCWIRDGRPQGSPLRGLGWSALLNGSRSETH